MRLKLIAIAITLMFLACKGIAQEECAEVKDEHTAIQFLLDNKADSTAAYRYCIDKAFLRLTLATQFESKNTFHSW
jgi:hypothetical protein